jgi:hypothetical protein
MVMADLAAPQTRKIGLGPIRRGSIVRHELDAVVDAVRVIRAVQNIPSSRFVGMKDCSRRHQRADRRDCRAFPVNHGRNGSTVALADDDHDLPLAGALLSQSAVTAISAAVLFFDVAAEIRAINLDFARQLSFRLDCRADGLADFVSQDERGLY